MKHLLQNLLARFAQPASPVDVRGACLVCGLSLDSQDDDLKLCRGCGAVWVAPHRFESLLSATESEVEVLLRGEVDVDNTFMATPEGRPCPTCGETMQNYQYQNLWLDACEQGHGIWLDPGELGLLRTPGDALSNLSTLLPESMRDCYRVAVLEVNASGIRLVTDQPNLSQDAIEDIQMICGLQVVEVVSDPGKYSEL